MFSLQSKPLQNAFFRRYIENLSQETTTWLNLTIYLCWISLHLTLTTPNKCERVLLREATTNSHKKRKDSLEIHTSKQRKMLVFVRNYSVKMANDFEAILATFYCYDYGANASEAVQKIAKKIKNKKYYHKCSSCVIVCRIAKIYQSITVKRRLVTYLLGHLRRSWKSSISCTQKGAITGPWWVLSTMKVR